MRDVLPVLERWLTDANRFALATVTQTWGSSPRPIGSVMGVREDGVVCGSVSGGCVESAVIDEALCAMKEGRQKHLHFGELSDEDAWTVGLSCGGQIDVWIDPDPVWRHPRMWRSFVNRIHKDEPCVIVTRFEPFEQAVWSPESPALLSSDVLQAVEDAYRKRQSTTQEIEGSSYFLHVLPPRERLLIVGSVHISVPLVKFAKELGFETVVIDPRKTFARLDRFAVEPDKLITKWPDKALQDFPLTEETYAVLLTHDPKLDEPALARLLRSNVAYIGALGSRRTHEKRKESLAAMGFSSQEIARIRGPVGLAIGARSPEEIALSIMAEIVQARRSERT